MTTEAEIRVMWPQAKNTKGCQQPPEARRAAWKGLSQSRRRRPCSHPELRLPASRIGTINLLFCHQNCGTWLWQPQETKKGVKCRFLGPASSLLSKVGMR